MALVDASIVSELDGRVPKNAPNFFVLDLPRDDVAGFRTLVEKEIPGAVVNHAPMLRGRIVQLGSRSADAVRARPEAQWVLNGDRGLSYADEVPEGSTVVAGTWWPKGYAGEPLVSFEVEIAKALGVGIGDTVTVNVLGRNVTARIANLREVHWESLAINFVMVFSPNALAAAPHNVLATIALDPATPLAREADLSRVIGKAYPASTAIRVGCDQLVQYVVPSGDHGCSGGWWVTLWPAPWCLPVHRGRPAATAANRVILRARRDAGRILAAPQPSMPCWR